jgi:hypothetical protein
MSHLHKLNNLIQWTTTSSSTVNNIKQYLVSGAVLTLEAASFALAWFYPIRNSNTPQKLLANAAISISIEVLKEKFYDAWQLSMLENTAKNIVYSYEQVPNIREDLKESAIEEIHKLTQHADLWSYQTIVTIKGSAILLGGLGFVAKNIMNKNYVSIIWATSLSTVHFLYCQSSQDQINHIKKANRDLIIKAKNNFDNPDHARTEMKLLNDQAFIANEEAAYLRLVPSILESLYNGLFSFPRTTDHLNKAINIIANSKNSINKFLPGKLDGHIYINKFVNWWFANYPRIGELLYRAEDINSSIEKLKLYGIDVLSTSDKNPNKNIEKSVEKEKDQENIFLSPFNGFQENLKDFLNKSPALLDNAFYKKQNNTDLNRLDLKLVSGVSILAISEMTDFYIETLIRNTENSLFYSFLMFEKIMLTSIKNTIYGNVNSHASYNMRESAIDAYTNTDITNADNKNLLMQYFMNSDPLASQSLVVMQGLFTSIAPVTNSLYKLASERNGYILGYISFMLATNIFLSFGYARNFFDAKYFLTIAASEPFSKSLSTPDSIDNLKNNFADASDSYIKLSLIRVPLNFFDQIHKTLNNQGEAIRPLNNILLEMGINLGLGDNSDQVFMAARTSTLFTNFHWGNYFRVVDWTAKAIFCADSFQKLENNSNITIEQVATFSDIIGDLDYKSDL